VSVDSAQFERVGSGKRDLNLVRALAPSSISCNRYDRKPARIWHSVPSNTGASKGAVHETVRQQWKSGHAEFGPELCKRLPSISASAKMDSV